MRAGLEVVLKLTNPRNEEAARWSHIGYKRSQIGIVSYSAVLAVPTWGNLIISSHQVQTCNGNGVHATLGTQGNACFYKRAQVMDITVWLKMS